MTPEYFSILGLAPGRYSSADIERRFFDERARWSAGLESPRTHELSKSCLDQLHIAYSILRNPEQQRAYLESLDRAPQPLDALRTLIRGSLEDGLLRHTRRQRILDKAKSLGLSEFHAHLMIAQIQFGAERIPFESPQLKPTAADRSIASRTAARFAAAGVLGLSLLLYMIHIAGV